MGLIGGAIGGLTSAVGAIAAGNKLAQNLKDLKAQQQDIRGQKALSQAHMEAGMYQGAGQSADFQANQTAMLNALRQANKEGAQTVTGGGSEAAKAAAKAQAVQAVGQMANAEAQANENRREQAYTTGQSAVQAWQSQDNNMQQYINQARSAQAKNIQGAAAGLAEAANALPF